MNTTQPQLRPQPNLAFATLLIGSLALSLSACSTRPKPSLAKPLHSDYESNCTGENAKPDLKCAAHPSAVFDPNGMLWVAWNQEGKIYISHSIDTGNNFSPPTAVNSIPENIDESSESRPRIAANKLRAVYVAWTQSSGQIRFSRSLDNGRTFTAPATISNGIGKTAHKLGALAVNSRDYIYLAWTNGADYLGRQDAGADLYYAHSTDGGRSFHPEITIANQACACCQISLKIDPKQLPVILWREAGSLVMSHFQAKDKAGPVQTISEDSRKAEACESASLSIAPKNGYFTAWASPKGLMFSSSPDTAGKHFNPPFGIGQSAATEPDILADDHSVFIIWKQTENGKSILFEQNSWDAGQTWSTPRKLAEAEGKTDRPFLLLQQTHRYAVWHIKNQGLRLIPLGG